MADCHIVRASVRASSAGDAHERTRRVACMGSNLNQIARSTNTLADAARRC